MSVFVVSSSMTQAAAIAQVRAPGQAIPAERDSEIFTPLSRVSRLSDRGDPFIAMRPKIILARDLRRCVGFRSDLRVMDRCNSRTKKAARQQRSQEENQSQRDQHQPRPGCR